MRFIFIFILSLLVHAGMAQGLVMGSGATMNIGENSLLYLGPSASLGGSVDNRGEIVSRTGVDFGANLEIGNLRFVGATEKDLAGDSLVVNQMTLIDGGVVTLSSPWTLIHEQLRIVSGSISANKEHRLVLEADLNVDGDGYIDGPVYGVIGTTPATFPTGINGAKNHLTISEATEGTIFRVRCQIPADSTLAPTEEMIGIADEVQWSVTAVGQQVSGGRIEFDLNRQDVLDEGVLSVDFSGVDLEAFSQVNSIRANDYEPALVYYSRIDSAYQILESTDVYDTDEVSYGKIETSSRVALSSEPALFGIARIPVLLAPTFFVPSAFAPQGVYDENHRFRPYFAGASITSVEFAVWDTFNEEVHAFNWQGEDIDLSDVAWDGTLNTGLVAPAGLYFFSVDIGTTSGRYTKNGSVLLVK